MTAPTIKHRFTSNKTDGTDNSLVRPSNWNDTHDFEIDSGNLVGRVSAGRGEMENIPCSAAAATMLGQDDIAAILAYLGISPPSTGDAKITLKTAADTGWVMMNDGTIGDASSNASTRANADTQALFTLIYNVVTDMYAPVLTNTGAATTRAAQGSAATAFANHVQLTLPKQLGRAVIAANPTGAGGLTARPLGSFAGEETHALTTGEMPSHYHSAGIYDPGHVHNYLKRGGLLHQDGTNSATVATQDVFNTTNSSTTGVRVTSDNGLDTTYSAGGGTAHNNMMPFTAWNVMLKL